MTPNKLEIIISDVRGVGRFLRQVVAIFALLVIPVSIGIAVESAPMQWVGFVCGIILLLSFAHKSNGQHKFKTTDEARAFLDKIDRGEA
ncbi:hypothetical protein PZ895_07865 [Mesorhizobium sp. YIM 152430]|uniref:hypothetical protein n=1 Tax=Mesorhizobium sp. YIM 152430 TaxID=3031761 RepID=UPI0023DAD05E|nr:hypothetical protein [Mesorhizobium sp. YIM 152430]MDF1599691.1 hypothetical protein [Mesorhizobium sp. YIM 152430]